MPKKDKPLYWVKQGDATKHDLYAALPAAPRLAIIDPPYNFNIAYASGVDDNRSYDDYIEWTRKWMSETVRCLAKDGSMWVFAPDEWVSEIDIMGRREFSLHLRRHVVWAMTFGVACMSNFARSHCHILYFSKSSSKYCFNADAIRVPSARQLRYNDPRANPKGKLPDATWMLLREQLEPHMTGDGSAWLQSRVCGTFKEREPVSPNQIPLPILTRITLACSAPGDWILDPCCGSGSTGVAALRAGRNFAGFDIGAACAAATVDRIKRECKDAGAVE